MGMGMINYPEMHTDGWLALSQVQGLVFLALA